MVAMKVIFVLSLTIAVVSAQIAGGIAPLSGDRLKDAEGVLISALAKLKSDDGLNYELERVISATLQVVTGSKYVYQAELREGTKKKTCTVEIVRAASVAVTFDCPDGKVEKNYAY